jgi:RNA recognition motif-containing protein
MAYKVFVGNLSIDTNGADLQEAFNHIGPIVNAYVSPDHQRFKLQTRFRQRSDQCFLTVQLRETQVKLPADTVTLTHFKKVMDSSLYRAPSRTVFDGKEAADCMDCLKNDILVAFTSSHFRMSAAH